jgi:hypothetical protein
LSLNVLLSELEVHWRACHRRLWLPYSHFIICFILGKAYSVSAVSVHDVFLFVAIALGNEQDIASIGRLAWTTIVCLAIGKLDDIVTIRFHDIIFIMTSIMG